MREKRKLLAALDAHKGRDVQAERQKKLRKQAEKRKRSKPEEQHASEDDTSNGAGVTVEVNTSGEKEELHGEGWETEESVTASPALDFSRVDDTDSESEVDDDDPAGVYGGLGAGGGDEGVPEDIPLSDIESLDEEEKGDIVPYQRLTINNTSALLKALKSIALSTSNLPFSEHQSITSTERIPIPDVDDDLNRELAFYKQSLDAVKDARSQLRRENAPFSRPTDYFAEMVKSDEHMGKIKRKMTDEAANKKAAAEARKQRDLKKFGKQVQVAKLQERDKAKRETLDKINILKRKRRDADTGKAEEDDLFDIALEDASKADKSGRSGRGGTDGKVHNKRQKRNEKFGFGGKKRFSKSGDAASSANLKGFSAKKMKGQKKGPQRLGKSRRAK